VTHLQRQLSAYCVQETIWGSEAAEKIFLKIKWLKWGSKNLATGILNQTDIGGDQNWLCVGEVKLRWKLKESWDLVRSVGRKGLQKEEAVKSTLAETLAVTP
jgi:hypothetical protein